MVEQVCTVPSASFVSECQPAMCCRYVGTCGNSIIDPSITATADRTAVMTGSIVGNGYYLSPFYTTISMTRGAQLCNHQLPFACVSLTAAD